MEGVKNLIISRESIARKKFVLQKNHILFYAFKKLFVQC